NEMVQKFLLFGNPTLEQLQFLEKELLSLPPRPKFAHMMETENLTIFDSLQELFRDDGLTFYFLECMTCMEHFQWYCHTVDQNIARRTFCEIWLPMYQKMTTLTNALQRQRFHQEWEANFSTMFQRDLYGLDVLSVRGRSELVGKGMIHLLTPSLGGVHFAILRSETRFRLAQIAIVLEQFRQQKGRYPENQEEVTPMLAEHGLDWHDPFTEKQTLVYRLNPQSQEAWQHEYDQKCERILKEEAQEEDFFLDSFPYWKPYLLYSFGSNQEDDGGIPLHSDGERADEVF
ncbi:MAG: hypothetical protein Q4E67_04605, partial [Planctomycetia bacterium]|nr:hypothetical protein [Planctomycetia bacterium]